MRKVLRANTSEGSKIITKFPRPAAKKVLAQDVKYVPLSYSRPCPLVAKSGRGVIVEDVDGNRFLNFSAGLAVVETEHCHQKVVRAIQQQAAELIHVSGTDIYNPRLSALVKKLSEIAPAPGVKRILFGNSGTEAIEAAMKRY